MWMRVFPLLLLVLIVACGREQPQPEPAAAAPEPSPSVGVQLLPVAMDALPSFEDREDKASMLRALDYQMKWLAGQEKDAFDIGGITVSKARMTRSLNRFKELWQEHNGEGADFKAAVAQEFEVYGYHWEGSPDILITGYHAPVYAGSKKRSDIYRYPIYALPQDMLTLRPSKFSKIQGTDSLRNDKVAVRVDGGEVKPYYSREEIDEHGALGGRGLELVYLSDYFEQFLFHVQGGGFVALAEGGYLKLAYAGQNGHAYTSIGRKLVEEGIISEEKISIQAIEEYFAKRPDEVKRVCYANASYVFYQAGEVIDKLEPQHFPPGVLGFPVTTRRSIATDKTYFAGGMIAYISGVQRVESGAAPESFDAFVVDQDTGGAIRRNHIDFFQGAGDQAQADAGLLKDEAGRVYVLLIKPEQTN